MMNRVALALVLLAVMAAIGCAGGETGGIVHPTWVGAEVEGNTVSIPASGVESGKMLHFRVTGEGVSMAFMAYKLDEETYVRANVCPPCRSVGFSLEGGILDCDTCHTKFNAATGNGITGSCKEYPKAGVEHSVSGGKITMEMDDLVTAYQNTGSPGWP